MLSKDSFDLFFPKTAAREYLDSFGWGMSAGGTIWTTTRYTIQINTVFVLNKLYFEGSYRFGLAAGNRRASINVRLYCPEKQSDHILYAYVPNEGLSIERELNIIFYPSSTFLLCFHHIGTNVLSGVEARGSYVMTGRSYNNNDLGNGKYSQGNPDQYAGVPTRNITIP